jgi:hypothetical protein
MPNKKSNRRRKKIGGEGNYIENSSNNDEPVNPQNDSEKYGSVMNNDTFNISSDKEVAEERKKILKKLG